MKMYRANGAGPKSQLRFTLYYCVGLTSIGYMFRLMYEGVLISP